MKRAAPRRNKKRPAKGSTRRAGSASSSTALAVGRHGPITVGAFLAVFVLGGLAIHPARTWLSQKQKLSEAEIELVQVQADVADLERQLSLLEADDEVERRARRDFHLVYPGEESYRILPGPDSEE